MNTRCFRLIFSKPLGFLIPVAEHTRAQRKAGQQSTSPSRLKPLVLSLLLASVPSWSVAEIRLDPRYSNTNVITAPNGVPLIEIADPNRHGLSHNRFTEFDVANPGVIFNNSLVNGTSQLGGAVLRNPNLSRTARAILSEITGNKPSSISGTLEVFGDKADILIAKGDPKHPGSSGNSDSHQAGPSKNDLEQPASPDRGTSNVEKNVWLASRAFSPQQSSPRSPFAGSDEGSAFLTDFFQPASPTVSELGFELDLPLSPSGNFDALLLSASPSPTAPIQDFDWSAEVMPAPRAAEIRPIKRQTPDTSVDPLIGGKRRGGAPHAAPSSMPTLDELIEIAARSPDRGWPVSARETYDVDALTEADLLVGFEPAQVAAGDPARLVSDSSREQQPTPEASPQRSAHLRVEQPGAEQSAIGTRRARTFTREDMDAWNDLPYAMQKTIGVDRWVKERNLGPSFRQFLKIGGFSERGNHRYANFLIDKKAQAVAKAQAQAKAKREARREAHAQREKEKTKNYQEPLKPDWFEVTKEQQETMRTWTGMSASTPFEFETAAQLFATFGPDIPTAGAQIKHLESILPTVISLDELDAPSPVARPKKEMSRTATSTIGSGQLHTEPAGMSEPQVQISIPDLEALLGVEPADNSLRLPASRPVSKRPAALKQQPRPSHSQPTQAAIFTFLTNRFSNTASTETDATMLNYAGRTKLIDQQGALTPKALVQLSSLGVERRLLVSLGQLKEQLTLNAPKTDQAKEALIEALAEQHEIPRSNLRFYINRPEEIDPALERIRAKWKK